VLDGFGMRAVSFADELDRVMRYVYVPQLDECSGAQCSLHLLEHVLRFLAFIIFFFGFNVFFFGVETLLFCETLFMPEIF